MYYLPGLRSNSRALQFPEPVTAGRGCAEVRLAALLCKKYPVQYLACIRSYCLHPLQGPGLPVPGMSLRSFSAETFQIWSGHNQITLLQHGS